MSVIINGDTGITTPAETVQGALTTTGNTILGDASTDTLNVGNGGLVKDASGNVGIGTASPGAKLAVVSGTSPNIATLQVGYSGSNNYYDANLHSFRNGSQTEVANIDSAGLFKFNSGYGSAATAYGCRAWVNFNGTGTVAIRASGNVSSITDRGTGQYTANFTTAMVDVNYATTFTTTEGAWLTGGTISNGAAGQTVGTVIFFTVNSGSYFDLPIVNMSVFR